MTTKSKPRTILILDDYKELDEVLKLTVESINQCMAIIAHTLTEALDVVAKVTLDAAVVDIWLDSGPNDSIDFCKFMHKKYPKTLLFVYSAVINQEAKEMLKGCDIKEFITKPSFNLSEIILKYL